MKDWLAVLLVSSSANASETCHSFSVPSTTTNWSQPFPLPKHDPALGALQSVTVTARCTIAGSVGAENPSPAPAEYDTRLAAVAGVERPDASTIHAVEPSVASQIPFAGFDGTLDFAGPSGHALAALTATRESHRTLTDPSDLALFTATSPGETITLGTRATGTSTAIGPGPLIVAFTQAAALDVTGCYGYRETTQSASIAPQPTNWQTTRSFAKHDPALGPLHAVRVRTTASISGTARHESLDPVPLTTTVQYSAAITVARPDLSVILVAIPRQEFVDPVTAYDGTIDFDGSSGVTHAGIQASDSSSATLTSAADIALFSASVPGEAVALTAAAQGSNVQSGSVISSFATSASAEIELVYDHAAPVVPTCFGDGSSGPCPCGNSSSIGAQVGCRSSFGVGAALRAAGYAEIGADTLVFTASDVPAASTVLFFQGASSIASVFGDGLRCAGGTTRRLGTVAASAGVASFPSGGATISQIGFATTGATLHYQAWYRNAAAFCTPSTFNLTNALSIAW